ncbi:Probable protease SohB [Seminavis robusta]|uniref:Probable protease SohB n=1 Tax=Seminavis robusta TaxID=568900 RepID=A0A9N8HV80_9STRA|nr:Probable protease SohB [Seminavis robusta]|eukprot:Sro1473_g275670.1 Probable protease SohB (658) ;mRNA; f:22915-24888
MMTAAGLPSRPRLCLILSLWWMALLMGPVSSASPGNPKRPLATLSSTTQQHSSSESTTSSSSLDVAQEWNSLHDVESEDELMDATVSVAATKERKNLTESWWPLWWGRINNDASNNATATTTDSDKKKKKRGKGELRQVEDKKQDKKKQDEKKQSKKKEKPADDGDVKKIKKKKKEEGPAQNTTSTDSSSTATNTTSTLKTSPPTQFIVMGAPPRGASPSSPYPRSPLMSPQQQQQQMATLAIAELIGTVVATSMRLWLLVWGSRYLANRQEIIQPTQNFVFERLNDRFMRDTMALQTALEQPPLGVNKQRWKFIMAKRRQHNLASFFQRPSLDKTFQKTVIVMEYGGNNQKGESDLKYVADLVSFLILMHQEQAFGSIPQSLSATDPSTGRTKTLTVWKPVPLEVVLKITSPGGAVPTFGYAAAQIKRLRQTEGISTTVCVDMYAASGGYMMASQADKLVAAPFATVGSVGVIFEMLNYHDVLRQYGVQPVVMKAGDQKNPISSFGAVTKQDLEVNQERLEKVHQEFQQFTIEGRPQLKGKEAQVCDGSVYLGSEALSLNLIDEIMTSDEYLQQRIKAGDRVLKIHRSHQSRLAPYARRLSPKDILPHLKARIEAWLGGQQPDMAARLVQLGSIIGFVHHLISNHGSKGFGGNPTF